MRDMKINQALDLQRASSHEGAASQERGARARERLLQEAIRIFAEKGYAGASTREICQAAGQNVASIHYYFGDKAGLYRAALLGPIEETSARFAGFDDPALSLEQALRRLMGAFLVPPAAGASQPDPEARLFLREMLEPSGAFMDIVAQHILPQHQRLVSLLARHVGLEQADEALHQMAFALSAMAHDYCMSRPFMDALAPHLLNGDGALERVLDRLVGYGVAMVDRERQIRTSKRTRT
jgi:AcrR family transcriptional regulator